MCVCVWLNVRVCPGHLTLQIQCVLALCGSYQFSDHWFVWERDSWRPSAVITDNTAEEPTQNDVWNPTAETQTHTIIWNGTLC